MPATPITRKSVIPPARITNAAPPRSAPAKPSALARPRRKLWPWLGALAVASVIYFSGDWVLRFVFTPIQWLAVSEVRFELDSPLTPADVRKWLPKLEGSNLFLLNAKNLLSLLEQEPWVRQAAVRKEYPNRLSIVVRTRTPEALAMSHGQIYFVDNTGWIARWESASSRMPVLPLIQWEKERYIAEWDLSEIIDRLAKLKTLMKEKAEISQIVVGHYPYLKVFLVSPKMEIQMTASDWESQVARLQYLISTPPRSLIPIRRINLMLPKKAIVSSLLSN